MSRPTPLACLVICIAAGCTAPPSASPQAAAPPTPQPAQVSSHEPQETGAAPDTPESVAQAASAYATAIQAMLDRGPTTTAGPHATAANAPAGSNAPAAARSADSPVTPAPPATVQRLEPPDVVWSMPPAVNLSLGPPQQPAPWRESLPPDETPTAITPAAEPLPAAHTPPAPAAQPPAPQPPAPVTIATPPAQALRPAVEPLRSSSNSDSLAAALARRVADYPNDPAAHLDHQLLQLLEGQRVPQMTAIAAVGAEDREALSALLDALSNYRARLADGRNLMFAEKVRPLVELSGRLAALGELRIGGLALCSRVDGFGVYEPLAGERLAAGREHEAIVYCEVENFSSRLNAQGQWETHLAQEVVLYSEAGVRVWRDKPKSLTDVSRRQRRDFYTVQRIRLPANLPAGHYRLGVTIRDEQLQRVAEATVPIQIVAP